MALIGSHCLIAAASVTVECWCRYEVVLMGPAAGNPFTGSSLHADFRLEHRTVTVDGFYDGEAKWRVRFMPDEIGEWTYTTRSSTPELNGATGQFQCVNPSTGNHGPVAVSETYLSAYADGARYVVLGD